MERSHRYQYRLGGYRLTKISLYVQSAKKLTETSFVAGTWIIGDLHCRFNAKSELLRCAVNPEGPCEGCHFFELDLEIGNEE